ncbi:MAG: hypothetical protein IT189_12115, partial [Microbacteriaceae bacterium]|nr:hypothetical protein [Microbacteriaceae bacterium]
MPAAGPFTHTVTTAADGALIDSLVLDTYAKDWTVTARDGAGNVLATATFTDAVLSASSMQGDQNPNGNGNDYQYGPNFTYAEGDKINFRFLVSAANETVTASGDTTVAIRFARDQTNCGLFFTNFFALGEKDGNPSAAAPTTEYNTPDDNPTVTVTQAPTSTAGGQYWEVKLQVEYPNDAALNGGSDWVHFHLQLSDEAGECTGSNQFVYLEGAVSNNVNIGGSYATTVPANSVIELPEIRVIKKIDRDGNGSYEDTADAGEFSFTLDGTTTLQTDSDGEVTFLNVTPDGAHTVTETQLNFSQGTYALISISNTNDCPSTGSTAKPEVEKGTSADNATCTFNNRASQGTITIVKDAVPNDAQDFTFARTFGANFQLDDDSNGTLPNSRSYTVAPGAYSVTEQPTAGWDLTGLTCVDPTSNSSGNTVSFMVMINVANGETVMCTFTNTKKGT